MFIRKINIVVFLLLSIALMGSTSPVARNSAGSGKIDHKVYIAFGFHVNLYHSFRNDTNDEEGYGKDIKVIRQTIKTLDHFNAQGVPVKAVWDFDNLFSLQERLPQHAPDIITNIRRRVQNQGDEVILMSYNNGLASAMNHQEMTDAIKWAISNPWESGVKDVFGQYSPIVRPQEMMTTPGNFAMYRKQGIKAVSLYYSATPFDAFSVFSKPLSRTEAYNPITYKNPQTNEEMTIIPTYHIGDLMENVSLRHWVEKLQRYQSSGEIDQDVLLYINYDADSEFWSGLNLSWPLNQLPNTGGLAALIDEVKDIENVEFTTLDGYLKNHEPVGEVFFGQDTADGSFDGYNSWSEKVQAHQYWTRIEHHRRLYQMAKKTLERIDQQRVNKQVLPLLDILYLKRLRALSTTNFGMATPFLAPDREASVSMLLSEMDQYAHRIKALIRSAARDHFHRALSPSGLPGTSQWVDTMIINGLNARRSKSHRRFLNIEVHAQNVSGNTFALMDSNGFVFPTKVIHMRRSKAGAKTRLKLYIPDGSKLEDGLYYLLHQKTDMAVQAAGANNVRQLDNGVVRLDFGSDGKPTGLIVNGLQKLDPGSLAPYIRYRDRIEQPAQLNVLPIHTEKGVQSVYVHGMWEGPDHATLAHGEVNYQYSLLDGLPYLFVEGRVRLPHTQERDLLKADLPALARKADMGWQEVVPLELRFSHRTNIDTPVRILKHNYLDVSSSYTVDYFKHAKANLSLDNINNHITAAYMGIVTNRQGVAVGMDTHLQSNFAFAPVKLRYNDKSAAFSARINPFGTYHGRQYQHPTWGNRQGYRMTVAAGEQFHSAGPTYNGQKSNFAAIIAFFEGDKIEPQMKDDLIHFARPPEVFSLIHGETKKQRPPLLKMMVETFSVENGVYLRWNTLHPDAVHYRIHIGCEANRYDRSVTVQRTGLVTQYFIDNPSLHEERMYYAVVEAIHKDGTLWEKSPVITFKRTANLKISSKPKLSIDFQMKVVWANIHAYLRRHMM